MRKQITDQAAARSKDHLSGPSTRLDCTDGRRLSSSSQLATPCIEAKPLRSGLVVRPAPATFWRPLTLTQALRSFHEAIVAL